MGNQTNYNKNSSIVEAHNQFVLDFFAQIPLFNIQDIEFPLSTKGIKIVDAKGRRVKLAGGNWSGAHMCRHCVDGLECRPMRDIAMDIRYKFKMNCIRLTYSLQMFFQDKKVPQKYLKANPELIGKTGMEIFDITIQTLTDVGLMVILNNHTSTSQWCCSNQDGDGLWWSRQFPQCMFFENAQAFAKRYKDNPRVIGTDLRNELRKAHGLVATWGDGNPLTDWKRAAKICADKVQDIAPHWLILVSGLDYQLDLTPIHKSQLVLKVPNKLVYTGHFYGFSWVSPQITSWNMVSYESFKEKFFNTQTFVRALGVPYFLGEFGNNNRDIPWKYLIKYLKQTDIDWTYWALDGFKCEPKEDQTYGVFTNDFSGPRHPDLLEDMISVGPPPGTVIERFGQKKQMNPYIGPKLQLQSPFQKVETQTITNSSIDAKFLLSAGGIRTSLESNDNKYPQHTNNLQKMPILGGKPQQTKYQTGQNSKELNQGYQQRQAPSQRMFKQTFQEIVSVQQAQQPPKQKIQLVQSKKFTKAQEQTSPQPPKTQQNYVNQQQNYANQQQNTPQYTGSNLIGGQNIAGQGFTGAKYTQANKNAIGATENLLGGLQGYQNPNNYQPIYPYSSNQNNLQTGLQANQGNALNLNPFNFSQFPTNNQGYNPNK